ncbi:MAG: hypothetical protein M3065_13680 [Actinomycetota bacterium]|nr:hypothetical protein [Actinomycetota bacterium]
MLARYLDGTESVTRVELDEQPDLFAFTVERPGHGPLVVLWKDGDAFYGEDQPPTLIDWPWPHDIAVAVDAFEAAQRVEAQAGQLELAVSVTPTFLSMPSDAQVRVRPSRSISSA